MKKLRNPKNLLSFIIPENYINGLPLFFTAFLCFLFTCYPIANYDIWWHLKTGEIIAKTAKIPQTDIFSFTRYGERWVSHEWLSEIIFYFIKLISGINGLIFFKVLIIGFILFVLYKLCLLKTNRKFLILSLVPIFLFLSRHRFFVRPHLFTMLFFAVTYFLLELNLHKKVSKKFQLIIFSILFLLWANFHGGFLYGVLLLYLYFTDSVFIYFKQKKEKPVFLFILSVICTLICLVNPNGLDVFLYPATIIKAGYVAANREWLSPFDKALTGYYMTKYFIVYSAFLFISFLLNFKKISFKKMLLLILFFGLSVKSQRNIPFFAVISIPVFIENVSILYDNYSDKIKFSVTFLKYLTIIIFPVLIVFFYNKGVPIADKGRGSAKWGTGINKAVLPVDAIKFIEKNNIDGNFFNSYQFGGYLLYSGYPKIKVFIDGRADVYGEQLYHSYRKSLMVPEEFQKIATRYDFDSILLEYNPDDKPLHDFLYHSKNWVLIYFDNTALIYLKNSPKNERLISKYGYSFVNPLSKNQITDDKITVDSLITEYHKALDTNPGIEYAYIRISNLYRKKGDLLNSLKISKEAHKRFPGNYTVLNQMGICYRYLKDYQSAEKCFKKAISTNPYILDAYGNMAILCFEQNDLPKTRKYLEKTLKINPDDHIAKTILKEIGDN